MLKIKSASINKYQKLLGKLQHGASFGIPGRTGLFAPIQMTMSGNPSPKYLFGCFAFVFKIVC
jgi:hypothetical protein